MCSLQGKQFPAVSESNVTQPPNAQDCWNFSWQMLVWYVFYLSGHGLLEHTIVLEMNDLPSEEIAPRLWTYSSNVRVNDEVAKDIYTK